MRDRTARSARRRRWLNRTAALLSTASVLWLAACGGPPAPPERRVPVKVMTVQARDLPLYRDFVGQVSSSEETRLRARVGGVLIEKAFDDGQWVKRGQRLFVIDPRELLAQQSSTNAQLAQARADLARARLDVARYAPLLRENAIARQVYDNAVAAERASQARVEAAQAVVQQAALGVEYATITAPFDGRIGAAEVFVGDLVTAGQTVLATISQDDPAWVYFSPSEADLLAFRSRRAAQGTAPETPEAPQKVGLSLSDGSTYPLPGEIRFADRALDAGTGTYRLRAEFPNPQHVLKTGMFARIRVQSDNRVAALAVPERAMIQMLGRYFVAVVGADGKAEHRPVQPGPRQGSLWVIDQGLKPGDVVVVEGVQKAQPGTLLAPTPVTAEELSSPADAEPNAAGADTRRPSA